MPPTNTALPPTDRPDLPSFLHPDYLEVQSDLDLAWDVWHSLKYCEQKYLPTEQAEPPKAYQNRLARSHFDNRFEPAIKGHVGLLSEFTLTAETAKSIIDNEKDIDLQGNDLTTFFDQADKLALRDGACAILVEHPQEDESITSNADLIQSGRRPYLVLVDRRDILNWSLTFTNGAPFINRVTVREIRQVDDGDFGVAQKVFYKVLRPGTFETYELVQTGQKWSKILIPEMSGTTSLDRVPLAWYSLSNSKLFQGSPPFLNLARLNIEHLQKRSSLNEVLHKINLPVPVRKGVKPTMQNGMAIYPKLTIGSNSVVDVPVEGDFYFAEPTGNAIAATQADIEKLERSMDRVTLAFLGGSEATKTATEVIIDSAQTQSSLKSLAIRKESCSQQIFSLWCEYTGEESSGSLDVNESVLQIPATPQEIQLILDSMGVQISRDLGFKMLLARRWLPDDTDIEKEANMSETSANEPLVSDAVVNAESERLNSGKPL